MNFLTRLHAIAPLSLLALAGIAQAEIQYEIIQMGILPGYGAGYATAINNNNRVVGYSYALGNLTKATQWSEGFGLSEIVGYENTRAYDINDNNMVAGYMEDEQGFERGFSWINGGWFHNNSIDGTSGALTRGINNLNQSVGFSSWGDNARATGWLLGSPGFALPNQNPPSQSYAYDLNDVGESVGRTRFNGIDHATVFHNNNTILDLHSLIPQGAKFSQATSINNANWIVGDYLDENFRSRGFYFNYEVGMNFLETPGFNLNLNAISDTGIIVGSTNESRAMMWTTETGLVDLNTLVVPNSGWTLIEAQDVNDAGWIVGRGLYNGIYQPYIAKPTDAVPEPATIIALGLGIAALVKRRRS